MLQDQAIAVWTELKEQIINKIYWLERDQTSLVKEVEKIVEIPIASADQAINYLAQTRMNCVLTKEDCEIKESFNRILEILLVIYRYNIVNEIDRADERELRSRLAKRTPQNFLLKDYCKNTLLLLDKIYFLIHGMDPNSNSDDTEPTIEEVD